MRGRMRTAAIAAATLGLAMAGLGAAPAFAAGSHVPIPPGYVYDPSLPDRTLHDYCSYSPDSYGKADFRGPCAGHDMCIEAGAVARSSCDATLYADLRRECALAYGPGFGRTTCYGVAEVYYAAVRAKTAIS